MAYKDKEKQKEANKEAAKRYRQKCKGMTQPEPIVIPEQHKTVILIRPAMFYPVDAKGLLTKERQVRGFNKE